MKVEDLKVGGYYNLPKSSFILIETRKVRTWTEVSMIVYSLYWVRHRHDQGKTIVYFPNKLQEMLKGWS